MENSEQRGTGIEKWSNGTVHFNRTGPTEKSGPPRKVDRCFRNFSGWTEPIHSVLDRQTILYGQHIPIIMARIREYPSRGGGGSMSPILAMQWKPAQEQEKSAIGV